MKIIATFSGGKDSLAATLWMLNNGYNNFDTVFCDTGWESEITYNHIKEVDRKLGLNLIILKSKQFDGMIDMVRRKTRFPSTRRRFCTSELKVKPMIDYILDVVQDDFLIIQGIRKAESKSRSIMQDHCNYFKYYFEPYGYTKNGKPKFHTYRKKDVLAYCKKYATDVLRPVFDWSAQQVIDYILNNGLNPNPLYKMGLSRVGCFPCVNCNLMEVHQINLRFPKRIKEIHEYEQELGSTFFPYDKISNRISKTPSIIDVAKYATAKYDAGELFEEYTATSCMSYYGLCE